MQNEILKELKEIKILLMSQKQMWNIEDFCAYTGFSKPYAYHLTSTGKIKCSRPFGKMIFFDAATVIEQLQQNSIYGEKELQAKANKYLLK